ncbi:MAG: hypothetical protein K2X35_13940 [Bryobacteraceae bacterium]|nr:hypothetical protein [Bryobacteraceae bacterium]
MTLCDIFQGLGEDRFHALVRTMSIGKLKTFQLYERLKIRLHLNKLNSENLKRSSPRFWARVREQDEEFAAELAQGILISHLEMIQEVLNFLGIPHDQGFFAKDADIRAFLTEGWQQRTFTEFQGRFPQQALLFYINHLDWEVGKSETIFAPAA